LNKILVLGAHGTVGSALVQALQAQGQSVVKATSRAPQAADQVHLNLLTGEGLATAFDGVDRAFLLSPPGHVNQDELLGPVIQAARQHGLKKVVLMSAMGADADEAAPLRKAERLLEASGLAWNVIRPNWFMQNFNSYWLHGILTQGAILLPTGTARGSFIDTRDIADVAAALLTGHANDNRAFDLTGPQALDHTQVAAILSQETGRAIGYQDITPEAMRAGLLGAGLPAPYVEFMLLILGFFKAGYAERTTDAVQQIAGHAPRSLQQYARDHRGSWLA
jgi:uncharacterized protein YbjT (DUF2867 family)